MDDATTVRALLDTAGFDLPDEDFRALVQGYPQVRRMARLLFGVEEARYEAPALVFEAAPDVSDWR